MAMVSEGSTDVNTTCSPVRPMDHFVERFEANTLYIDSMIVLNNLRYNGEGESGFHLMSSSMVRRLDPLLNALLYNSYGIVNLLKEGRVCMYKVDSSKACIGNYCP
jgi:hypothetical protein